MNYNEYYRARGIVQEILEKDLLGPLDHEEVINDYPITYYIVGKLYPQECRFDVEHSNAEDAGEIEEEQILSLDSGKVPSSMGMSFALSQQATEFSIKVNAARYVPQDQTDPDTKKILWKRKKVVWSANSISVTELVKSKRIEVECDEGLKLLLILHKTYKDGSMAVTATLVNTYLETTRESRFWVNEHTYFQPEISVIGKENAFTDIRKNIKLNFNQETVEMEMLYSKYRSYVTGYGCAAEFKKYDGLLKLYTLFLPTYEFEQMMPSQNSGNNILSMKYLSEISKENLISELCAWIEDYKDWIVRNKEQSKYLSEDYYQAACNNINKCNSTYNTIKKSIQCLRNDEVYKAFIYANEVMFMQRKKSLKNKGVRKNDDEIRWFPFQLAFILQEVLSFAEPNSIERKNVDLLWFPTGGGKTEAYLGISAFVIFLRRMRNPKSGSGVSIIMRYTLRLLTFQQFERASAMICACELLRKKYNIPGEPITIGLWAGKALTPNTIEMADKILNGYKDPDNESSNPMQLEKCPWCGSPITREEYSCNRAAARMNICCSNHKCEFEKGLPVSLIDEQIYEYNPTFLVATVDKFAQVAHNEKTFSIFAKNKKNLPPELIIQDELHLISGPLGTITGIYEAAFRKMCMHNEINAKVIASTATIKNASEQIRALYGAGFTQFPPQGIDTDDSYFAIKATRESRPSRLYMGCMGTGTSSTSIMVRVMAAVLYATRYLEEAGFSEEVIDSFWTITNYFNTLKELGGAIIRVVDNVQDRFAFLKETKFKRTYPITAGQYRYDNYIELTSREKSENIGKIIQNDLLVKYQKDKNTMPYDFILASNMISVGIDISRLNTMLVVGQPKTTAEYIQATSRVGRDTPGFVFTMYNCMRSRDKSHFEQFCQYHAAFYKYVEATSVTPFAERARDRALQTLYVMLCRFYISELEGNNCAGNYSKYLPKTEMIRQYILDYVSIVDPDECENVEYDIDEIENEWEELAQLNPEMTYRKDPFQTKPSLFKDDYEEDSRFRVMNSMRSVETTVQVITRE